MTSISKYSKRIFVFGSNLAGVHGAGSARAAVLNYGAIYGQGVGLQGSSYAIPTKDHRLNTLPLERIKPFVSEFILHASMYPENLYNVVEIGCGLAGYSPNQIAPMFREAPQNVHLPVRFVYELTRTLVH